MKRQQLFFSHCFVPHLHTFSTLRSARGYYIHNTASFRFAPLLFIPAVFCLSPRYFWRLLLRTAIGLGSAYLTYVILEESIFNYQLSTMNYQLVRSLCPKYKEHRQKAVAFYFLPAVSRSQYCTPLRKLRFVPVLRWLFDCRNPATALLTINNLRYRYDYFLLRCLGVFNCRLYKDVFKKNCTQEL